MNALVLIMEAIHRRLDVVDAGAQEFYGNGLAGFQLLDSGGEAFADLPQTAALMLHLET
jgi:hypothetical protein